MDKLKMQLFLLVVTVMLWGCSVKGVPLPSQVLDSNQEVPADQSPATDQETVSVGEPVDLSALEVGTPGHYVNLVFGYSVSFPETWYTRFGNRPLVASFSNLDPGTTNRETMRATGCLIEISADPNVYGFSLDTLATQLPETYRNAKDLVLGDSQAVRMRQDNANAPYGREIVQLIGRGGHIITISAEMAHSAESICQPVWETMLASWESFTPEFEVYRNPEFGFTINYPGDRIAQERPDDSTLFSSLELTADSDLPTIAQSGMVVRTDVHENPTLLPLKEWLQANIESLGLTNDIVLDSLRGVRSIVDDGSGVQTMTGFFQGPLGKIYRVECSYPEDRQWEYRPIANAIVYSFTF